MKGKKEKKAEEKKEDAYKLSLVIAKTTYIGEGDTPFQALANLERPGKLMAKGTLTAMHGKLKKEMYMTPVLLKRLFYTSSAFTEIKAKQIFSLLKETK